jgi:hypothetical protein
MQLEVIPSPEKKFNSTFGKQQVTISSCSSVLSSMFTQLEPIVQGRPYIIKRKGRQMADNAKLDPRQLYEIALIVDPLRVKLEVEGPDGRTYEFKQAIQANKVGNVVMKTHYQTMGFSEIAHRVANSRALIFRAISQ